jgi:hypothetical protein
MATIRIIHAEEANVMIRLLYVAPRKEVQGEEDGVRVCSTLVRGSRGLIKVRHTL